jgi:hypothetical protein
MSVGKIKGHSKWSKRCCQMCSYIRYIGNKFKYNRFIKYL